MGKYCSNCGKALNEDQEVCLKCGRLIRKEEKIEEKQIIKAEEIKTSENKIPYNGYYLSAGIISIVLGALFTLFGRTFMYFIQIISDISVAFDGSPFTSGMVYFWLITMVGVLGVLAGIFTLCGRRIKPLMIISGAIFLISCALLIYVIVAYAPSGDYDDAMAYFMLNTFSFIYSATLLAFGIGNIILGCTIKKRTA